MPSPSIYHPNPSLPPIDTATLFTIAPENGKLRVQSKNVNCLFSHLTRESFDQYYNDFHRHLNLDFEPLELDQKVYALTKAEQEQLTEKIITSWIYFYTINDLPVVVKRSDFEHPYMVDFVLSILDRKFRGDTPVSLALGAKILRQKVGEYSQTVLGRRRYYDK